MARKVELLLDPFPQLPLRQGPPLGEEGEALHEGPARAVRGGGGNGARLVRDRAAPERVPRGVDPVGAPFGLRGPGRRRPPFDHGHLHPALVHARQGIVLERLRGVRPAALELHGERRVPAPLEKLADPDRIQRLSLRGHPDGRSAGEGTLGQLP